jgi:intracellular septation protein A
MQWQLLFFSMAPVVAFMAFRAWGPPRRALVAAIAVAALELAYNSQQLGGVEPFSLASFTLFGLFGGISLHRNDERFFKLQPVALDLILAGTFLYYGLILDIPLFAVIMEEYVGINEILPPYQKGYASVYATTLSRSLPYLFLVHAGATAYAAIKRSTWGWFHVRVFGFYAMLGALFLVERLLGVTP